MKVAAILAAAGAGRRLGAGRPKALVSVGGKTILRHAYDALAGAWPFEEFIVTAPPGCESQVRRALGTRRASVVSGGVTRALSIQNALRSLTTKADWVLIHDAARPLVDPKVVRRTVLSARAGGAAAAAVRVSSTVKRADPRTGSITGTVDRQGLYLAQTPQVFRRDLLTRRFEALGKKAAGATDDAALFDGTRVKVKIVEDSNKNFKITTRADLELAKYYLGRPVQMAMFRVGIGYDIHALKKGRRLVLGGAEIPHSKGLAGHSDGDVLLHALTDAVLGAAAAGDIGAHFPDGDKRWKDADSRIFVKKAVEVLKNKRLKLSNLDAVVLAEEPKLAPYREKIRRSVAKAFGVPETSVGLQLKTNEGFGAVGQGRAIACHAAALAETRRK